MCRLCLIFVLVAFATCNAQPAADSRFKGSITGRVLDENGQPFPRLRVVVGRWQYHHGRAEFHSSQGDDNPLSRRDGGFIARNLDPGTYFLRAEDPYRRMRELRSLNLNTPAPRSPAKASEVYVTTYFPGVSDVRSAMAIEVKAGAETSGIEFRVQAAKLFHIRGSFVEIHGLLTIKPRDSVIPEDSRQLFPGPDGKFDISRVLQGTYVINDDATRTVVTVTESDVNGVIVQRAPCPKIRSTITRDGAPFPRAPQSHSDFELWSLDAPSALGGTVDDKTGVSVECAAPEFYEFSMPLEPGTYVKSVKLDGRDVTNTPLDLTSALDKRLDIDVSSKAADLRGIVRDAAGNPQPGTSVTAWSPSGFNVTVVAGLGGVFEIGNLAPGEYRIAAWEQLHSQPSGWGVQTMREFRNSFESAATKVMLGESEHGSVEPVLIPRVAIEEAAQKLRLFAEMTQPAEEAEISRAAKSPFTLAEYVESHPGLDWDAFWKALGMRVPSEWWPPCGSGKDDQCSPKIERVSKPDQTILIIPAASLRFTDIYVRYLQKADAAWQVAGERVVNFKYDASRHELARPWDKPFLKIVSDHSQVGFGMSQHIEDWFDLTQPDFEPVFSITLDGWSSPFGGTIGCTIHAQPIPRKAAGIESIDVILSVKFDGPGLDLPATYSGVYERRPSEKKFTLRAAYSGWNRTAKISNEDFEELADPMDGPSNEKLVKYALPGLRKIATGSDTDAKEWLDLVLENTEDTAEKQELLRLMKKR